MMNQATRSWRLAHRSHPSVAGSLQLQSATQHSRVSDRLLSRAHKDDHAFHLARHFSEVAADNKRLEYQHSFHAGNFADVVKHVVLVQLIQHMQKNSKPIGYVETHAGAGLYSLQTDEKDYETEHQRGIFRLLAHAPSQQEKELPLPISTYLEIVQSFQPQEDSKQTSLIYPGSPLFAASLLRQHETKNIQPHSMRLCDKSPDAHQQLQTHLEPYTTASIDIQALCHNGYTELAEHAQSTPQLPPRSLIVIDPPYQFGSDTEQIVRLCQTLRRHWRSARIAVWHPVRADHAEKLERLYRLLKKRLQAEILTLEAYPPPSTSDGEEGDRKEDVGSGMILIQPPYGMDQECRKEVLPKLLGLLYPKMDGEEIEAMFRVEWL